MHAPGRTATAVEHSAGGFGDYSILCWTRSIDLGPARPFALSHIGQCILGQLTNQPTCVPAWCVAVPQVGMTFLGVVQLLASYDELRLEVDRLGNFRQ